MRIKDVKKEEAIEKAIVQIVFEKGIAGLKMNQVAKKAQVGTGTLYTYYENKEAILSSVYKSLQRKSQTNIASDLNSQDMYPDKLKRLIINYIKFLMNSQKEVVFMDQFKRSPFFQESFPVETDDESEAILFHVLEEGQRKQYLKQIETHELLRALDGIIKNIVSMHASSNTLFEEETVGRIYELCLDCIRG